jgi:ketosteroid isomerase-like protein
MSQENVEIVRQLFDAFNEGALNPEDLLEYFTDDIDYRAGRGCPR